MKPQVFISYSHTDTRKFVERLDFALGLYADVFWDRRIPAGVFPSQLADEIASRKFFISVMSSNARHQGSWWEQELCIAEEHHATIIPARVEEYVDMYLANRYTYADFSEDFETGFRRLTFFLFDEPRSSWEHLAYENNEDDLFAYVKQGHIPALICKGVGDWLIVDQIWHHVSNTIPDNLHLTPRVPQDTLRAAKPIMEWLNSNSGFVNSNRVKRAFEIIERYVREDSAISDSEHERAGKNLSQLIDDGFQFFEFEAEINRDFAHLQQIRLYFRFNTLSKLRELILLHARRSRYLY